MDTALATGSISLESTMSTRSSLRLDPMSAKLQKVILRQDNSMLALKCSLPFHADPLRQQSTPNLHRMILEPTSDGLPPRTPMFTTFSETIFGVITRFVARLLMLYLTQCRDLQQLLLRTRLT